MLLVNREKLDEPKKDRRFSVFNILRRLSGDKKSSVDPTERPDDNHFSKINLTNPFLKQSKNGQHESNTSCPKVVEAVSPLGDSNTTSPGITLFSRNNSCNSNLQNLNYSFFSNYTTEKSVNSSSLSPISPIDTLADSTTVLPKYTGHVPSITDNCNHITIIRSTDDGAAPNDNSGLVAECVSLPNSEMTYEEEKQSKFVNNFQKWFVKPQSQVPDFETVIQEEDDNDDTVNSLLEEDEHFDPNQEESELDYRVGGYHRVSKGEIYQSSKSNVNYLIVRKLGWGHFSTVWLARALDTDKYVAIKFVKSNQNYLEAAEDEIKILNSLQDPLESNHLTSEMKNYFKDSPTNHHGYDNVMKLVDHFDITGPHGHHICMVFELLGENMLNLLYKYKHKSIEAETPSSPTLATSVTPNVLGLPLTLVKPIVRQLLSGLDYMHHCGVIHTDLKPENILVNLESPETLIEQDYGCSSKQLLAKLSSSSTSSSTSSASSTSSRCPISCSKPLCGIAKTKENIGIKIADLGNATYSHVHFTNQIQTRQYRSPEIILQHKTWGASTDLWSVGCIIFELITGDYLFDPHDGTTFSKDDDHLAQIIELLGELPPDEYLLNCRLTPKYFKIDQNNNMALKKIDNLRFWSLEDVLIDKYKFPKGPEVKLMADLIKKCLRYKLDDRFDAGSLLSHPWLNDEFDYSTATPEAIDEEIAKMCNSHDDIPGFTSICGENN
jgi:serine/threonine-protein kinase SRPK3